MSTLDGIRAQLVRIQKEGKALLAYFDFGWAPDALDGLGASLADLVVPLGNGLERSRAALNAFGRIGDPAQGASLPTEVIDQSLAHAVGALVTLERVRGRIDSPNLENALSAKLFYQLLAELLDDVVDFGAYPRETAEIIFGLALKELGEEGFSERAVTEALRDRLSPDQSRLAPVIASLAAQLTHLLRKAPRWEEFHERFRQGNEQIIVGQGLSMLFRDSSRDPRLLEESSRRLDSPDPGLPWQERLAKSMGHVSNLALLDFFFADPHANLGDLDEHARAWYYYDIVIDVLDHLLDLEADSRAGITNLALLAMHPDEARRAEPALRSFRTLRQADYECLTHRLGELVARASKHARNAGLGSAEYYRMLNATIPIVMYASSKDRNRELLETILRSFATATRESFHSEPAYPAGDASETLPPPPQLTTYSQWSSRFRTQRVFTTVPWAPRALSTPS